MAQVKLSAQAVASITGVVTDPKGAVIPGAHVTLENSLTGAKYTTDCNGVGSYTINQVKPGPGYQIEFKRDGFKPVVITGLYLNIDSTRTQNARMSIGTNEQVVVVSAANQDMTLDTTDATVGNNFQVQMLNDLPIAFRDSPAALFYAQPGVTLDGAVTGARTDQTNVTLDGLEMNDNATGDFGYIVGEAPVDSVQEFRGVVGEPLSSAGQGGGGQFELVTKSGTNKFHGALVEYHRDTDTEANDWFNNNAGVGRPPLVRNQFGGNVGGPIMKNKAFFFFDYNARRDARSFLVDRTVPMGTNTTGYRGGEVAYINSADSITTLSSSQVAGFDPMGTGWDSTELSLFQSRYPIANDLTGDVGDSVNTAGFRFNSPDPYQEDNYVQRVDYNINDKMKIFGRGTVARRAALENPVQFPGDPEYTYPFYDRSYSWVVGHNWQINKNMLNQAYFGETYEDFNFVITYNPQGDNQYSFAGLDGPYGGGNNSQARTYPIPIFRDDFSWDKGRHNFTFGGSFKWETPQDFAAENYNFPNVGVTGNTNFTALAPNLRPSDISSDPYATTIYDNQFSTALGAFASTSTNFNYNNKGVVQQTGSGLSLTYRYYETEAYFGDSWKVTPELTISYGMRYENYTVPYETHGDQASAQLMNESGSVTPFSFDQYWAARQTQSAGGISSDTVIPFIQYIYGGKANNAAGYYNPDNRMFAPRFAFAYNPRWDKKTVISGGAGIVYDHSIINALQFQQLQSSYLFEANNVNLYGTAGDPTTTLSTLDPGTGGTQRFAGISSPPLLPDAPDVTTPYQPYVFGTYPYGLPYGEFNILINPDLKNPYNIEFNFGVQHEFPQGYLLKATYMGRLGRRLLAEADASQLIEFPDNTGLSTQTMSQAMAGLTQQLRANVGLGPLGAIEAVTPQPWFEDVITPGVGVGSGFNSNTELIAYDAYPYPQRGDFADTMQYISTIGFPFGQILPANVGMASQFAGNTVWTNKGSSSYNALLVTLHKNAGYGLQFDLNYTWAHSIDNVSAVANFISISEGYGYICDVNRPRECRGNSDFDVTQYLNGNFIYELPFGRGKMFAPTASFWLNEAIGGWEISGLPARHTGVAYNAGSNAYVAGFANNAPATLIGPISLLKAHVNGGKGAALNAFSNPTAALGAFTGPTGFDIGTRNNLRGPGYFNLDLGLGKTFPIYQDKVNLKFRCDAFNALNHPNFNPPDVDITQANGLQFGTITSTYVSPGSSDLAVRVLQLSLRLAF
ncbi:MAG: carboxypeptidase-like regulatory domain-containing protein [Terracidiphilus sp.]